MSNPLHLTDDDSGQGGIQAAAQLMELRLTADPANPGEQKGLIRLSVLFENPDGSTYPDNLEIACSGQAIHALVPCVNGAVALKIEPVTNLSAPPPAPPPPLPPGLLDQNDPSAVHWMDMASPTGARRCGVPNTTNASSDPQYVTCAVCHGLANP